MILGGIIVDPSTSDVGAGRGVGVAAGARGRKGEAVEPQRRLQRGILLGWLRLGWLEIAQGTFNNWFCLKIALDTLR